MRKGFVSRVRKVLREESGLATVEWIGLAIVIIAVLVVVANALQNADGSGLATQIMNAIGRMVARIQ